MAITAHTRVCALIGDPVKHSFSPLVHNAAFETAGLDFVYVAFPVKKGDLPSAIEGIRRLNIAGVSITIPHKVPAAGLVDCLDPVARDIGSINTLVNRNGILTGFNSDGSGALKAFEDQQVNLNGKSVLMLGSGGAARAVAFTLALRTGIKEHDFF